MENQVSTLTMGTTKTTNHVPGYGGFLPNSDINDKAIGQGASQANRSAHHKVNMAENYQVKIPGYQGYKPLSVVNDRGQARPNCFSTAGENFF